LRISFIEFLNAAPLGWGFLHGSLKGRHQILFDVPSECARKLASGAADAGLIPVIEYQRISGLRVVPGISIAARAEVRSVLFLSRKPIHDVQTVAVDVSSRTSVVLLKILLEEFHGCRGVDYVEFPPNPRTMLEEADAALLIGNPALAISRHGLYVYDLAAEWNRFTGLPFVFAFWAVREGVELAEAGGDFEQSRREGLQSIPFISEWYSSRLPISSPEIRQYLTGNLNYRLDEANLEGLRRYYDLAAKLGLIERPRPLEFLAIPSAASAGPVS